MFQAAVTSISVLYANINDVRMAVAFTQDYSSQWHMLNYLVGVIEKNIFHRSGQSHQVIA